MQHPYLYAAACFAVLFLLAWGVTALGRTLVRATEDSRNRVREDDERLARNIFHEGHADTALTCAGVCQSCARTTLAACASCGHKTLRCDVCAERYLHGVSAFCPDTSCQNAALFCSGCGRQASPDLHGLLDADGRVLPWDGAPPRRWQFCAFCGQPK